MLRLLRRKRKMVKKIALVASIQQNTINDTFEVLANATNVLLVIFDLRKNEFKEEKDGMSSDFILLHGRKLHCRNKKRYAELTEKFQEC